MGAKYYNLKKRDFDGGSPFLSWLKEELIGEIGGTLCRTKNRGLIKKYKIHINKSNYYQITDYIVCKVGKFDDLSPKLQKVATDIIRMELDKDFKP